MESRLVATMRLLHTHGISFPVSMRQMAVCMWIVEGDPDLSLFSLFLWHNENAAWASDTMPSTWQDDQIADARYFFHVAKVFVRLTNRSTRYALLDIPTQRILATYINKDAVRRRVDLCLSAVAPMTAELAFQIALWFARYHEARECCEFLNSFFGEPMVLPEPGTSPKAIYSSYVELRGRALDSHGYNDGNGLEWRYYDEILNTLSPVMFTRLVCCRAQAATILCEGDERQWWRTAMALYDVFPTIIGNSKSIPSSPERICANDYYRFRDE
ncbi:hypothetical protein F4777DRAFT_592276 [Nemania sp. FL0916]|nr:hypothetical protein F4777DRAFT_592276 [Nemania sp. FL0916]